MEDFVSSMVNNYGGQKQDHEKFRSGTANGIVTWYETLGEIANISSR